MDLKFRLLKADEIDCRISTVNAKGVTLLLYKNARVDMNLLDEVVGAMNWQRSHSRDNANCTVSIWDNEKKMWVSKEDVGVESYSEAQKGLASDSFKRACFNWGIGRELYTAPFVWIPADKCKITEKNGKFACYDRFTVREIAYDEERKITRLVIEKDGDVVYRFGHKSKEDTVSRDKPTADKKTDQKTIGEMGGSYLSSLKTEMDKKFVVEDKILERYKVKQLEDLTFTQYQDAMKGLEKTKAPINPPEVPDNIEDPELPWNQGTPLEQADKSKKKSKRQQANELYNEVMGDGKFT